MIYISITYPDLTCKFPDENDPNKIFSDVTIEAKPYVEKYYQYFDAGDFIAATKILNDNPSLKNMIINAAAIQNLYDMCIASQRFYLSDVQQFLVDIVKYKDEWSNTAKYTKYNVVTYIQNGGRESFIAIRNDIPIGTLPTNMDYYVPLTMRGEKGVSGAGLSPRGLWSIEANYYVDDLVVYKNRWYYAKRDNSQSIPKLVSDDWGMILEVTQQIKTSETQPTDQSYNDVWIQKLAGSTTGEYNIALNQVDVEGNYVYLYPKTRGGLVSLSNGKTVQEFCDTMNNSLGKASGIATTNASNKVIQTALKADSVPWAGITEKPTSMPANGGNAATATALQTTRTINGVNFNGTSNITISAAANGGTSAACSGNAVTATRLQTARAINGVNFDGTAAITISANPNAHNQGAATITGGTLNGVVLAQTNTSYTTRQLRNVIESTAAPSGGANGDIWLQYK